MQRKESLNGPPSNSVAQAASKVEGSPCAVKLVFAISIKKKKKKQALPDDRAGFFCFFFFFFLLIVEALVVCGWVPSVELLPILGTELMSVPLSGGLREENKTKRLK